MSYPTIRLTPEVILKPNLEHGAFLTATVNLLWFSFIEDIEPYEEIFMETIEALRPDSSERGEVPWHLHRPRGEDDDDECVASMTVQLLKGFNTYETEDLLSGIDEASLDLDALTTGAERLAHMVTSATGNRIDLIEQAMHAADEGQIGWVGMAETWGCTPLLDKPEIFGYLVDALSVISGVFNGLFIISEKYQKNVSAHERIQAHAEETHWKFDREDTNGRLRLRADGHSQENTLLIFAGVQNMDQPQESYRAQVILPDFTMEPAPT